MKQKSTDKKADAPQLNNEDFEDQKIEYDREYQEDNFNPDNTLLEFHLKNSKFTNYPQTNHRND